MAAHPRVGPIRHIKRAIRTHANIGRAEIILELGFCRQGLLFFDSTREIGTIEIPLRICGHEIRAIQLEANSLLGGLIAENHVSARLTRQQRADEFLAQCAVFIIGNPCR